MPSLQQSFNRLHPRAWDFIQLGRFDRPIGIYLLLWPTLWALWLAAEGMPSWKNLIIFILGTAFMRAAGCAVNDYADRDFDGHVKRTNQRPLASGRVTPREALITALVFLLISFGLVLMTNRTTVWLSLGAVALAACYPFMKRYTHYPQVVLGMAYSWGIPMAFTAETGHLPLIAWLIYIANIMWTVAYDTYYAMCDRDDDLRIGVKSTAILFGRYDRQIIATLQGLMLLCLVLVGVYFGLGLYFYISLAVALGCFIWEYRDTRDKDRLRCFNAFLHNHWAGLAILIGIALDYALR